MSRKDANGCRPDALFGLWLIDPSILEGLVSAAEGVDLVQSRSLAAAAEPEPAYRLMPGGIAEIQILGPMTKYPTSVQAIIGGTSTLQKRDAVRQAGRDRSVKGIYLKVDSPGGTAAGIGDLSEAISEAAKKKPVHVRIEDKAASAALYAISGATRISANASGWVGSIGTFAVLRDTSAAAEAMGHKYRVVSSGGVKGAIADGVPLSEDAVAEMQRIVDTMTEQFVSAVAKGRGLPISRVRELADGRMHTAKDAQALGLIDAVETDEAAVRALVKELTMTEDTTAALALAEEQQAKAEALAKENAQLKSELEALRLKADPPDPLAALSPEQQALFASQAAELAALKKEQRDARFAAEAKALNLPNESAQVLDTIEAKLGAESYASVQAVLGQLRAQIDTTKLFGEIGSSAPGSDSAEDQILATAKADLAAGKHKTLAEAVSAVAERSPELYARHRKGE